jgi:hypothetical protein
MYLKKLYQPLQKKLYQHFLNQYLLEKSWANISI